MHLVQGMYSNARSRVRVGEGYSEEFEVKVGVHQGSVLSPLLFIIVLEALSREFRCGVPWEDLYADDLVIIAESLEECVRRLLTWKEAMEEKGLRVNAGKTKIMICGTGLDLLQSSGEFPCAVCRTGVGSNSIFCKGCKHWVHKKCKGLKRLTEDPDYRCTRCKGTARPLDGRPQREVQVGPDKLEVVASFCYLGDMLSAAGGCELSTTTRVKTAWKKFKDEKNGTNHPVQNGFGTNSPRGRGGGLEEGAKLYTPAPPPQKGQNKIGDFDKESKINSECNRNKSSKLFLWGGGGGAGGGKEEKLGAVVNIERIRLLQHQS